MNRICVSAVALMALAGAANAQVEFRIVEMSGQTQASSADAVLDFAVQARVTGGAGLGTYNFNILTGDAESSGTLLRLRVQNADRTYYTGAPTPSGASGTKTGLPFQYNYLAGINSSFNGLINGTSGSFTNNPLENEIGLIAGSATGSSALGTPGMDPGGEGNPATWSGYGAFNVPPNNSIAPLDPAIGATYFGQGQFVDVYRFRYTVSDFTARTLNFTLNELGAQVFSQWLYSNGEWGAATLPASPSSTGLQIQVVPTPASAALMGLGGLVVARRRRA